MHVHPKAQGHEAHGTNFVGGTRKKPQNRDEVGAVKDHFSEGRQQEEKRQRPKQSRAIETKTLPLAEPEVAYDQSWQSGQALAAKGAVLALHSLLKDVVPEADQGKQPIASPPEPAEDPSLDDLLAFMLAKP